MYRHFVLIPLVVLACTLPCKAQTVYFSDTFENGMTLWLYSGQDWDTCSVDFRSSSHCISDSPTGNYPANANEGIESASSINLSSSVFPVLTFWHKYALNNNSGYNCYNIDSAKVEISTDGGFHWILLTSYTGFLSTWNQVSIDLRQYRQNVKLRFRVVSGGSCQDDGWYVDDVVVSELKVGSLLAFPFADTFENGLSNWLTSGRDWTSMFGPAPSGMYSITESLTGNYPSNANSIITLAGWLDLTSAVHPMLSFWHRHSLNNNSGYNCYNIDYGYVEISSDGGFRWSTLSSFTGYLGTWSNVLVDLSSYRTDSIKIRFRLNSGGSCEDDGWRIDDVSVHEFSAGPRLAIPFSDNFENGLNNWIRSTQDWDTTSAYYRSTNHSISDSRLNYASNSSATITLKGYYDLRQYSEFRLLFWQRYALNNNSGYNCYNVDSGHVEVSGNGGLSWIRDTSFTGYQSTWGLVRVNLLKYRNAQYFKVRFRLTSGGSCEDDGWYIDDVQFEGILDTNIVSVSEKVPNAFSLIQNYPNPFNPSTTIRYQLPTSTRVSIKVFDVLGREVAALVDEMKEAGEYSVQFDATNLSSGVYLYRLQAEGRVQTRTMLLLR